MQFATFSVMVFAVLVCSAGCSGERFEDKKKDGTLVSVVLNAWNEHVQIDARAMTIVHTRTEYEYANPTSATPSSHKTHKLLDGKITPGQLDALAKFIRTSGFMDLKDAYGAPANQRFYPYRIDVTFEGQPKKSVEFRSNPEYGGAPDGFTRVEMYLKNLSTSVR